MTEEERSIPRRVARNDDSLAIGLAKNLLRDLEDKAAIAVNANRRMFDKLNLSIPMNERRARRIVKDIDEQFRELTVYRYECGGRWTDRVMSRPAVTVWDVLLSGRTEGIAIGRTIMSARKHHRVDLRLELAMLIQPHVIARLFQRYSVTSAQELLQLLRAVSRTAGLTKLMARRLHHRQWGMKVGDDAMLVGEVYLTNNPELGDYWLVNAKTYIRPVGNKWRHYLNALESVQAELAAQLGTNFLDATNYDPEWELALTSQMLHALETFSGSEHEWLLQVRESQES